MANVLLLPGSKGYLFVVITEEEAASLFRDIIRPIHIIQSLPHPSLAPVGLLSHMHAHGQTRHFRPSRPFPGPETQEARLPPHMLRRSLFLPRPSAAGRERECTAVRGKAPSDPPRPPPLGRDGLFCSQTEQSGARNARCWLFFKKSFHALT